jgi:hypothetical protein
LALLLPASRPSARYSGNPELQTIHKRIIALHPKARRARAPKFSDARFPQTKTSFNYKTFPLRAPHYVYRLCLTTRHLIWLIQVLRSCRPESGCLVTPTQLPITYRGGGGSFGAVTTRVNTRLGPPLLITHPNPALGRAATAPEYPCTRF